MVADCPRGRKHNVWCGERGSGVVVEESTSRIVVGVVIEGCRRGLTSGKSSGYLDAGREDESRRSGFVADSRDRNGGRERES